MSKMRPVGWDQLSRRERQAAVLYPNLVSDQNILNEMKSIAQGEGKSAGLLKRMNPNTSQHRSWWEPQVPKSATEPVVLSKYENVPGLVRRK